MNRRNSTLGFSLLELLAAVAILMVLSAMVVPAIATMMQSFRLNGSSRAIASQLSLARMRAAGEFTQARLNFNLAANPPTYQLELLNKGTSAFAIEGGVQTLSTGVVYGSGAIGVPAGSQTTVAQTAQIVFNSRGIPVDNAGAPTGLDAIYLNNSRQTVAITVYADGRIARWRWSGTAWTKL
jgi:Tfp pilus assembly protein FimT